MLSTPSSGAIILDVAFPVFISVDGRLQPLHIFRLLLKGTSREPRAIRSHTIFIHELNTR